jgi:hypothetical protein
LFTILVGKGIQVRALEGVYDMRGIFAAAVVIGGVLGLLIFDTSRTEAANVNNIRTITNQCPRPVVIRYKDGAARESVFTINANQGWNGEMWIPWADSNDKVENWRYIEIDATTGYEKPEAGNARYFPRIKIFQYNADIWFVGDNGSGMGKWDNAVELSGGKGMGNTSGERSLIISRSDKDQLIVVIQAN